MLPTVELSTSMEVKNFLQFLESQQTFSFPSLSNGLFTAALFDHHSADVTGYHHIWLRDNCQIAHAHYAWGDQSAATKCVRSLLAFYHKQAPKMKAIIQGTLDPTDPMNRPHIRFCGDDLSESHEKWAHAQNDALGYLLWLSSKMILENAFSACTNEYEVLNLLVGFLAKIQYWQDEDSGHWEEVRKVAASSIGCVVAGLRLFQQLHDHPLHRTALLNSAFAVKSQIARDLEKSGWMALNEILPFECIQQDPLKNRKYDSALLFLIYPLNILEHHPQGMNLENDILQNVQDHLQGPSGVRRYLGDSYWCADYKKLLSADTRTADFSDNQAERDRLLQPGMEAQWCLFDPILSIIYGKRFLKLKRPEDREQQRFYLHRALNQITPPSVDPNPQPASLYRFPAYRCPESYYCEGGNWVPNDICPLLWTQANLKLSLLTMQQTASL